MILMNLLIVYLINYLFEVLLKISLDVPTSLVKDPMLIGK